jgi:diadenosine tetraphosphate (Ap4A) HIT family hydrolase
MIDETPEKPESNCYLCSPRESNNDDRREIARLKSSTLYLFTDQRFRGYCFLIYDKRHETALDKLSESEYLDFMSDLRICAKAIRTVFNPDHMNLELLGNTCSHLHWHIVPRYKSDPRWGQPIWEGWLRNEFNTNRVILVEPVINEMVESIRNQVEFLQSSNP